MSTGATTGPLASALRFVSTCLPPLAWHEARTPYADWRDPSGAVALLLSPGIAPLPGFSFGVRPGAWYAPRL
jgi:hypothetical protein